MHDNVKQACGEVKYPCGANSIDCHVQKRVKGYTRTVELGVGVMCCGLLCDRIWYDDGGPGMTQNLAELVEGMYM